MISSFEYIEVEFMAKKSEIDGLKTIEQRFKEVKWNRMFVERRAVTSKAFLDLKTAAVCQVFMIFLYKNRANRCPERRSFGLESKNSE